MTLEERLLICKTCENRKVDYEKGVVCELTGDPPTFEQNCPDYIEIPQSRSYPIGVKNQALGRNSIYRPNKQRARYALAALITLGVLQISGWILGYFFIIERQKTFESGYYYGAVGTKYELLESLIQINALLIGVTFIALIVVFINWFRRAYFNLHLRFSDLQYTDLRAAWCWFVPLANFYWPYAIMREMWIKTKSLLVGEDHAKFDSYHHNLVGFWWLTFVLSNLTVNLTGVSMGLGLEYLRYISYVKMVMTVISYILVIIMVKRYSRMEETVRTSNGLETEIDLIGIETE